MLKSDEIISPHLSKIFCDCKSLLNVEAVCHPCEECLCNAAVDIDLPVPMILALAHSIATDKAGTSTGKSCSFKYFGGKLLFMNT